MEESSEGETIVDESVELCDSPSILTGLFQICRESSQPQSNMEPADQSQTLSRQHCGKLPASPDFSADEERDTETHSPRQRGDTALDSLSQQSDRSQSIFTQRTSAKRKSPIVTLCSPVFAQAPLLKLPKITDDASNSTDTHLSESPSFQLNHNQVSVNDSPSLGLLPNQQTQSSDTTIPSEQEQELQHPQLINSKRSQVTSSNLSMPGGPPLARSQETHQLKVLELASRKNSCSSLNDQNPSHASTSSQSQTPMTTRATPNCTLPVPKSNSSGLKTVTSNSSSATGSVTSHRVENFEVEESQKSDDDASLVEMERMQQEIREKMSKNNENKYADQIKRSLQDMQARLCHLSARQREHRQQLSTQLKQQTATPGSQQQQQDARLQLQNMTRRQQHLLKLLQSHKELAAALQQMQEAEHSPLAQSSGKSSQLQKGKPSSITQRASGGDTLDKSSLPAQETTAQKKEKEVIPPSSVLPSAQVPKTKTRGKPIQETTSTKTFKPPFKADPPKRPRHFKLPSTTLADGSTNLQPRPATFQDASVSTKKDKGGSSVLSPPYSLSSSAVIEKYPSETTGLLVKKGIGDSRGKEQNDETSQRDFPLQTESFSADSIKQTATMTTSASDLAGEVPNTVHQPEPTKARQAISCASATRQAPLPLSSGPVSKTPQGAGQASSLQTASISVDNIAKQNATSQRSVHPENIISIAKLPTPARKETSHLALLPTEAPLNISSNPASELPQPMKTSAIPVNTQTLVRQLLTSLQNENVGSRQSSNATGPSSASSQPRQVVYKIIARALNDPGNKMPPESTSDAANSVTVPLPGKVPTQFHDDNVGSTTSLPRQCQAQRLSSSSNNSSASAHFQKPAMSNSNFPSNICNSVPGAFVSTTLSTIAPHPGILTKPGKEPRTITGNQSRTSDNLQGKTETHKKPASSQPKKTAGCLASQNQTPPNQNPKSSDDIDGIPSLQNLLQTGVISPGENVLSIKITKGTVNGSLSSDGTVRLTTPTKNSAPGWVSLGRMVSLVKHRSFPWIRQNPSIWKSVFYRGKPMDKLHADYKALIARDRQTQSRHNAGNQETQGTATTTTSAESSIQEPLPSRANTNSAHPLPLSKQHTPVTTSHQEDRSLGTSSRGTAVTSWGLDLMTLGQCITTPTENANFLIDVGLVSSMEKVLLISNDELIPASWDISSTFRNADDFWNAAITPEWVDEMDVWT